MSIICTVLSGQKTFTNFAIWESSANFVHKRFLHTHSLPKSLCLALGRRWVSYRVSWPANRFGHMLEQSILLTAYALHQRMYLRDIGPISLQCWIFFDGGIGLGPNPFDVDRKLCLQFNIGGTLHYNVLVRHCAPGTCNCIINTLLS